MMSKNLILDYDSLIWTELFDDIGEFELVSSNVKWMKSNVPVGTLLGIRQSSEIMIVESHELDLDEGGFPRVTLKGRNFVSILELRFMRAPYQASAKMLKTYRPAHAIAAIIWNQMCNLTGVDITQNAGYAIASNNVWTGLVLTASVYNTPGPVSWWCYPGEIWAQVKVMLANSGLGIRSIRTPTITPSVSAISFNTTTDKGALITASNASWKITLDIYNGLDRSANNGVNSTVILRDDAGHFGDSKFLESVQAFRNIAVVAYAGGFIAVNASADAPTKSNFDRRVMFIDGGSQGTQTLADFMLSLQQKGYEALRGAQVTQVFDGEVTDSSPYLYRIHYKLGDYISVVSSFGLVAKMKVVGFTYSSDRSEEKQYPTLTFVDWTYAAPA
jgi:hypothetical protein